MHKSCGADLFGALTNGKEYHAKFFNAVILSEVRRQPNEVEGPHACWQQNRLYGIFPRRLIAL